MGGPLRNAVGETGVLRAARFFAAMLIDLCSLFFFVLCSLFFVLCSLFSVLCSLFPIP